MRNISVFETNNNFFETAFFLSTILEWKNLDQTFRNSSSFDISRNSILIINVAQKLLLSPSHLW